jgi:potassium efflux system protein
MFKTWLIITFFCVAGVIPANAQDEAAAPAEIPEPETAPDSLSTSQIATRADQINAELLRLFDLLQKPGPEIGEVPADIDALASDLEQVLQPISREEISVMRQSHAEPLLQTLNTMKRKLSDWRGGLEQRTEFLDQQKQLVKQDIDYLQKILASAAAEDLPESLVKRLESLSGQVEAGRVAIRDRLDLALGGLSKISAIDLRVREYMQLLEMQLSAQRTEVFAFEAAPIWQLEMIDSRFFVKLRREFRARIDSAEEYIKGRPGESATMAFFLLFLAVIGFLAHRSVQHSTESGVIEDRRRAFLERPAAIVALLWAIIGPFLFLPSLPVALIALRLIICAIALWRLMYAAIPPSEHRALRALILLAILAVILNTWSAEETYGRLALIVMNLLGIYWFRRFGQALRETTEQPGLWIFLGRFIAVPAPYLLGIGILGIVFGAVALADQLSRGLFLILIAILSLTVIEGLLNTLAEVFLASSGKRWLRFVRNYPKLVQSRVSLLIRLGMVILLIMITPRAFPFLERVSTDTIALFTERVTFGTLSVSLADVLGLIISVVMALAVARFIRFILDEDVFPRLPVAAGAAAAASRLIYYTLVLGGIFFALAAAGVELSSLTLLVSALGVGIGFGLQGIVNNFVSGLVLAFERPFQTGDMIAVGQLMGRVRQIGLRASRIRTFDGAEVIVPNANLIGGELINWTLSDQMRRGDVSVNVAYGADTARVREVLLKVAADNDRVATNPEPTALLLGFDDSSMNFALRVWISVAGDWLEIADELYDAVHGAFVEAGIEIPFPQRTVHLHEDSGPGND